MPNLRQIEIGTGIALEKKGEMPFFIQHLKKLEKKYAG
jgi:ABC-type tungstate transport system permease subunit